MRSLVISGFRKPGGLGSYLDEAAMFYLVDEAVRARLKVLGEREELLRWADDGGRETAGEGV